MAMTTSRRIPSLTLLCLVHLAQALSTAGNTTTNDDSFCSDASASYRSLATILTSCCLTLLICVWHAVHPDILPTPRYRWYHSLLYCALLVVVAFLVPEFIVERAYVEWKQSRNIMKKFREKGYAWTMTHSHFTLMGGFVLRDRAHTKELSVNAILNHFENKEIANPVVDVEDIMDKSSSDELAKLILVVQLLWFILQIIVRGASRLAITLIELDTLCMSIITFPIFFFWWGKPRGAGRPYVFYVPGVTPFDKPTPCRPSEHAWFLVSMDQVGSTTSSDEDPEENSPVNNNVHDAVDSDRTWRDLLYLPETLASSDSDIGTMDMAPLFITWMLFGALHMIAVKFQFPSQIERSMWFIMSLSLVGVSAWILALFVIYSSVGPRTWAGRMLRRFLQSLAFYFFFVGIGARIFLVVLMLASLRDLPVSAYRTIPWTAYIPHL